MAERTTFAEAGMRPAPTPPPESTLWRVETHFEEGPTEDGGIVIEPMQLGAIVHLVAAPNLIIAVGNAVDDIVRANGDDPVRITRCTAELMPPVLR